MKKLLWIIVSLVVAFFTYKYAFKGEKKESNEPKPEALSVSGHTAVFNESVAAALNAYHSMVEGFINWDSAAVNKQATELQQAVVNLKIEELQKDSAIYETVLFPLENAKNSVAGIATSGNWQEKRRALQDLSENLRMLLITVKYDEGVLYWQECPMAFTEGSTIGNWLSKTEEVVNPYLGKKDPKYGATMLNCGEAKEKIDFTTTAGGVIQ